MASSIQLLRSTIAQERPFPGNLLEGQPAVNLNASEPGLFFKAADGSLVKFGPAAITSDGLPPNSASQGVSGNTIGELWLDKSVNPPVLKIYDGTDWIDAGSGSGGGGGSGSFMRWVYTSIGGETSLSGTSGSVLLAYTVGLEEVYINGVLQTRGVDYSATNGTSITNLQPLTAGDVVTVLSMNPLETVVIPPPVISLLRWSVLASAGQTVFSGLDSQSQTLSYTAGFEEVFINGAFLRSGVDYTATDGSTITLTSPASLDDEITVLAFDPFQIGVVETGDIANGAVTSAKIQDGTILDEDVSPTAGIDSAKLSYATTGGVTRLVSAKLKDTVSVLDYGADPTGASDSTAAINAALTAAKHAHIPAGTYRIDGTITIESNFFTNAVGKKSLTMTGSTRLIRRAASSTSTAPVLLLKGNYGVFDGSNGEIESENDSPNGVVALGQLDTNSAYNALFWTFKNCGVRCKAYSTEPVEGATVGVYIPSSQPTLGSNAVNYFGTVENVRVYGASVSYWLTDIVNAHTLINTTIEFFWHYGYRLNGAYGNTIYSGFINGCKKNGGTAIYLGNKLLPAAPFAASHQSSNNNIYGASIELYTSGNFGVYIPVGVSGFESAHNVIQIGWNSSGTAFTDLTVSQNNQCDDGQVLYTTYKNFKITQGTGSGTGLLKINGTFPTTHYIGRNTPTGSPVVILENQNTNNSSGVGMQIQWNTPVVGFNTQLLSGYHKPTTAFRFDILDTGDMRNVNNAYGPLVSERRFKQDITDASSQWDDIKEIRWRNFRYIKDVEQRGEEAETQFGVIIDELESICPNLITESPEIVAKEVVGEDGETTIEHVEVGRAKSWKTSVLLMKGMKALQEAMERIETLEAQVIELTDKLEEN
jgi:hypothetical protein